MKVLKVILQSITIIINKRLVFCIIIIAALFFTAQAYKDNQGTVYSVLELMIMMKKTEKEMVNIDDLSSINIFINSVGSGYFCMFLPIFSSYTFISMLCEQRNNKYIKYSEIRCGYFNYYFGSFVSCVIGGGIVTLFGYILFGLICNIVFPFSGMIQEYSNQIFLNIFGVFVFGMTSTLLPFLFSALSKNMYINIFVPFMLIYIYDIIFMRVINILTYSEKYSWIISKIIFLQEDYILKLRYIHENLYFEIVKLIALYLFMIIVTFTIFCKIMNRRIDKGE